jgi:hypothetical protein
MKYVHHYIGDWVRNDANTSATREPSEIREYSSIESIDDPWVRNWFETAQTLGERVLACGSHVFQIRDEESKK